MQLSLKYPADSKRASRPGAAVSNGRTVRGLCRHLALIYQFRSITATRHRGECICAEFLPPLRVKVSVPVATEHGVPPDVLSNHPETHCTLGLVASMYLV